ncbi:MAG: hypothetical protein J5753_06260 [Oscillospiraceae bacterium]|nr:hypothetical protein [Oscillospiraceae bacterium]
MAKKQERTERTERRRKARSGVTAPEELSWRDRREYKREHSGARSYTLMDCMKMGRLANILFIAFIVISLIYYTVFSKTGAYFIPFEVVAFSIEAIAFVLFAVCAVWLDRLVRARGVMKVLLIVYITAEVVLMLNEFGLIPFMSPVGKNTFFIIAHVIFSAGVSLSLLMLDPQNRRLQTIVIITTAIILSGMLTAIAEYRVYASILVNAIGYIVFFSAMVRQLALEEMDIDCYGDQAKVSEISSTMFADTPTMVEIPGREVPVTLEQKLRRLKAKLTPTDERIVLTDDDEKFEYEFGADADDDDDDEYDADGGAEYEDDEDGEDA